MAASTVPLATMAATARASWRKSITMSSVILKTSRWA